MDDRKRELLERMAAKGLYIADLQAIDEYEQRKKDAEAEKEAAKNSKDVSPLLNTVADSVAAEADMSKGIQDATDKYFADNGEALRKLFLGLPVVKEASKTDKGKRDVENWLAGQLSRGGDFYKEILNHYSEDIGSRLGDLRTATEADLRKAARNVANWRHAVRGAGKQKKQELQGYLTANAQQEAKPEQVEEEYWKLVKELQDDVAAGIAPGKKPKVRNPETGEFWDVHWDVPSDIPLEHRDAIILLMNRFDTSGLVPGSFSPPPSPAEEPMTADPD